MRFVFSTNEALDLAPEDFTLLVTHQDKHYYISTDYLNEFLKMRNSLSEKEIFFHELKRGGFDFFEVLELWLGVVKEDIIHLTIDEVGIFLQLYEMKSSEDLFLNLGEQMEGDKSVGELIFLNALADLIYRGRK